MTENHRPFKAALYKQFQRIGNALSNDRRLELLDLLAQGPRHVEALAAEADMPVANVSQHLQVLQNARLVESDREGTRVVYRLASDSVLRLWLGLEQVAAERLAEVGEIARHFGADRFDRELSPEEVDALLRAGKAVLIDVRPTLEYESGHLPGALSLPVDQLVQRLKELPRTKRIVAYCRGEYCLFADEAVAILKEHGYDAVRLDGGWVEWRAQHKAESSV